MIVVNQGKDINMEFDFYILTLITINDTFDIRVSFSIGLECNFMMSVLESLSIVQRFTLFFEVYKVHSVHTFSKSYHIVPTVFFPIYFF